MDKIKSLDSYIRIMQTINTKWFGDFSTISPWYRGHSNYTFSLVPGIYRSNRNIEFEREINRDFILRATPYIEELPHNAIEWLFVMQHYGVATRLLDWTESYLVALYFAVLDYNNYTDACVWVLNPWDLNIVSLNIQSVIEVDDKLNRDYTINDNIIEYQRNIAGNLPVAIRPTRTTKRIAAQRGCFTIHGSDKREIEKILESRSYFYENMHFELHILPIIIDGTYKRNIFKQLYLSGISYSNIFPDLDGLSKEIMFRYSKDFQCT